MAQQPPPGGQPPDPGQYPPPQGYPPQQYPPQQQPPPQQYPPQEQPPQQYPPPQQPPPQQYPPQQQPGYGGPPPGQQPYGQPPAQQPYGAPPGQPYGQQPGYGPPGYAPAPAGGGYASWGKRLVGIIIDAIIIAIPANIIQSVLGVGFMTSADVTFDPTTGAASIDGTSFVMRWIIAQLITAAIAIPYSAYFHSSKGQTIGKMAMKIKVVHESTGQLLDMTQAAIRGAVQFGLAIVPYVGGLAWLVDHLFPLWDPKKQSIHDKVAKSVVIDAP